MHYIGLPITNYSCLFQIENCIDIAFFCIFKAGHGLSHRLWFFSRVAQLLNALTREYPAHQNPFDYFFVGQIYYEVNLLREMARNLYQLDDTGCTLIERTALLDFSLHIEPSLRPLANIALLALNNRRTQVEARTAIGNIQQMLGEMLGGIHR